VIILWNNRTKNLVRTKTISLAQAPIRNGVILPSDQCEDVKLAKRLELIDDESFFEAYEEILSVREVSKATLEHLGINYKMHCRLETKNMSEILNGRKSNFVNLDLCGMLSTELFNWLYYNFKVDGKNWLEKDAFISFNIKVTPRTAHPNYIFDEHSYPNREPLIMMRSLNDSEKENAQMIFSTLSYLMPYPVFYSDEIIYESDGKVTTMVTCTFLLGG
jgi:hypothetical protein